MRIWKLAKRVLGIALIVSVGGLALAFVGLWTLDEYRMRTGNYLFMDCNPPSLTEEMARGAVELAARQALGLPAPQVSIIYLERLEQERWPTFFGRFIVMSADGKVDIPGGSEYFLAGNGCGVEIHDPQDRVVVYVILPSVTLFSVRRGTDYKKF